MTVDWAEERVYVGSADGRIYQVELMDKQGKEQPLQDQSDDEDDQDEEGINGGSQRRRRVKFLGHEKGVTCLSVSIDGSRLLSGKFFF